MSCIHKIWPNILGNIKAECILLGRKVLYFYQFNKLFWLLYWGKKGKKNTQLCCYIFQNKIKGLVRARNQSSQNNALIPSRVIRSPSETSPAHFYSFTSVLPPTLPSRLAQSTFLKHLPEILFLTTVPAIPHDPTIASGSIVYKLWGLLVNHLTPLGLSFLCGQQK